MASCCVLQLAFFASRNLSFSFNCCSKALKANEWSKCEQSFCELTSAVQERGRSSHGAFALFRATLAVPSLLRGSGFWLLRTP